MQHNKNTQQLLQATAELLSNQANLKDLDQAEALNDDKDSDANRKVGKWTPEEDEMLKRFVPIYGEKQWRKIAEHIPGRTSIQCLHRWTKILRPGLVKGPWTTEEDQKLITWVKTEGPTKWAQCANFIKGRSGKQCRERWFNNLNPGVKKGNWAKEEDELIFELYQKYGSSWSKIAKYIPGRTENAIKNRFYSTLRKLAADKRKIKGESVHSESGNDDTLDEINPGKREPTEPSQLGPNILYKLLQEKTELTSTKDRVGESIKQEITSPATIEEKPKQAFNINGEKFVIVRDNKVPERVIQNAAAKLAHAELEENDSEFENFLLTLDSSIRGDFITKELDKNNKDIDDISQFEKLQKKILIFCQNNISDLTESFKNVANNRIDNPNAPIKASTIARAQTLQQLASPPRFKNEVEIHTPMPTANKDNKPVISLPQKASQQQVPTGGKGAFGFNYYNQSIPSPLANSLQVNNKSNELMSLLSQPAAQPKVNALLNTLSSSNIGPNPLTSLVGMIHQVQQDNNEETEKRMTFLFQQLFSLESLLTNTRNELMKLESTIKKDEKGHPANPANIKIEEENDESKMPKNLQQLNSTFEKLLKNKAK